MCWSRCCARQHLLQLCLPLLVRLTRRLRGVQLRQGLNMVGGIAACKQLLEFMYGPYLSGQYWQLGVDNANVYSWLVG
jgi:hypothetical protein